MRNAFADEICRIGVDDPRVVLLSGDIGNRLFDPFKDAAGERFVNCGVAEQNMMSVASGLALSGFRPVVYTITPFTTYRCFEQIRIGVCYHRAPVLIVGTGSGLAYASLGPTHHSMEDIAILRTLPGMTVFCPADAMQVRAGLRAALALDGPVYMRIGKKNETLIHEDVPQIELGRAMTMREGSDVCLVGTGVVMPLLLDAAERLAALDISARVENYHTVKPLDETRLQELAESFGTLVVAEEHGRIGGLFGAISEWMASYRGRRPHLLAFGSTDSFLHEIGTQDFARRHYGISPEAVVEGVRQASR